MDKMYTDSNISRLDIRLLFNKAEKCRKQGLNKVLKLHCSLKTKSKERTVELPSDRLPTADEITSAFDGVKVHTTSSEPYYWELAYNLIRQHDSIPIDSNGLAHIFTPVTNQLPNETDTDEGSKAVRSWHCNSQLCNYSEDLIIGTANFLHSIAGTHSVKALDFYLHIDDCKHSGSTSRMGHPVQCSAACGCDSLLRPARTMSVHYPRLRTMVRRVYEVRRICQHIHFVDCAMSSGDYMRLKLAVVALSKVIEQLSNATSSTTKECCNESDNSTQADEQSVMDKFGKELRQVTDIRDSYISQACDICEQLRSDLQSLESYVNRSNFSSEKMADMIDLLYQHKTRYEDVDKFLSSTFICRYCADKLKCNKDIARSAFNCLSVVPTPECLATLNLFERTLIKFAMTCMTVIRLGNVSNKSRPNNELTAALKGRIAYLPVDVCANAQFVPDNLFNVDSLVMLVGGQPTKNNKVWVSAVDLNKVHSALAWLRVNNWLYKNVPAYSVEDIRQKINEKMGTPEMASLLDGGILRKLDEAAKSQLYENFTIQPLSTDYPADCLIDYQLGKIQTQSLNIFETDLDVAAYPELFPTGEHGMKEATRKVKIGTSDYIKSRLLNKDSKFRLNINYLFHCFQVQEVSNMCHSIGHMLRTVSEKSLSVKQFYDRLKNKDGEIQSKLFSLMANIRGSKEYFAKLGMEVRWMIKRLGPPTLFLTCSTAEWFSDPFLEYLRSTNSSVTGIDKMTPAELCSLDPVNVSIHFHKKWEAIFTKLIKSKQNPLFGEVADHFWRIEYQSRGAPHVHCVLWIKDAPMLGKNTADEVKTYINSVVTCSLPDATTSPTLHDLVCKFQKHKCNKYCMKSYKKNGKFFKKCRFGFPRSENSVLKMNDVVDCLAISKNNQPRKRLYHLPRKAEEENINDYNAALLLANQANVDVQYVGHLGSRLPYYITEYMTKNERSEQDTLWQDIFSSTKSLGSNAMAFLLKSVQSRQVGANEAADRLLGHKLYSKSRQMRFADLQPAEKAKRVLKPMPEIEQLLKVDPASDNIFQPHWVLDIYPDRPDSLEDCCLYEFLAWHEREKVTSAHHENQLKHFGFYLRRRKNQPYIVTHQVVNPNQSDESKETYYYYLLKLFKPWRSESDICDAGMSFYETYVSVKEHFPSMVEYHESTVSQSKREQDFEDAVKQRAQKLQNENGTGLDLEDGEAAAQGCLNDHIQNAMNDVMQAHRNTFGQAEFDETEINESYAQLNVDQKRIVDTIISGVCNGDEQVRLIVSGPGGTGKSRVIHVTSNMVCNKLKSNALPVVVCAPTGLSAFNIGGSTIHRVLCLPVEHGKPADYSRLNQEQLTTIRATLKNLKLLIIDEVSMVSSLTLLYIHLRLTEIMCSHELFGGISVVFFADFLQLPPVKGNQPFIPVTYLEAKQRIGSVSSLDLWQSFTYDELTINMRQKGDATYANLLSNVRVGIFTDEHNSLLQKRMITPGRRATVTEICSRYQSLVAENLSPLILMPRTSSCEEINQAMLIITGSQIYTISAIDTQDTITDERMTAKVTKAYKKTEDDVTRTAGLEKKLQLCIGARVMLKRNKDVEAGLVNGSVGNVVGFQTKENTEDICSVIVKFPNIENPVSIYREAYSFEVLKSIYFTRKQFPLMLAFAITIHKSQGLSLQSAIIDAGATTFGCGMTYVALSRVTSLLGLHLIDLDRTKIKCDRKAISEYNRLRQQYTPHLGTLARTDDAKTVPEQSHQPDMKENCREFVKRKKTSKDDDLVMEKTRLKRTKLSKNDNKDYAKTDAEQSHQSDVKSNCREFVKRNKTSKDDNSDMKKTGQTKKLCKDDKKRNQKTEQNITKSTEIDMEKTVGTTAMPEETSQCVTASIFKFCSITSMSDDFRRTTTDRLNLPDGPPENTRSTTTSAVCHIMQNMIYRETNFSIIVTVHKIIGDGNCLFRALSLALTQNQCHHELIRAYIVNHMTDAEFRDEMEQIFISRNEVSDYSYHEHVVQMQNAGVWGTEHEIVTAAHLLQCSIVCLSEYGGQFAMQHFPPHFPTECTDTCSHESIFIINKNDHYDMATVYIDDVEE